MTKQKITTKQLRKKIDRLKKDKLEKQERTKLEREIKQLEDDQDSTKKVLNIIGKTFLGIGNIATQYAKKQSEKKR